MVKLNKPRISALRWPLVSKGFEFFGAFQRPKFARIWCDLIVRTSGKSRPGKSKPNISIDSMHDGIDSIGAKAEHTQGTYLGSQRKLWRYRFDMMATQKVAATTNGDAE
jgi:hypothetical protein